MFSTSSLTPEQKDALHQWAAEGATISDLQRRLKETHGISLTYMDARLLVLDLNIQIVEPKKDEPKAEETPAPVATGYVSVRMDSLKLPGSLVSGKVTFSDGETAVWMIDETGRMGFDPDTAGYRPNQEDTIEFQTQLRELIRDSGM
ncbi:MAG: hypothetical protein QM680_02830 [Luteolibacter sp.]